DLEWGSPHSQFARNCRERPAWLREPGGRWRYGPGVRVRYNASTAGCKARDWCHPDSEHWWADTAVSRRPVSGPTARGSVSVAGCPEFVRFDQVQILRGSRASGFPSPDPARDLAGVNGSVECPVWLAS